MGGHCMLDSTEAYACSWGIRISSFLAIFVRH
uniref:Uncharacterized protein n=1 Tax=Arundo donax TaxID=35708 RepID=A0A0A9DCB3_ARUDO